jgi:hypothetical protein
MESAGSQDPFLEKFFGRIQPAVARSFTPSQLAAIRLAFESRGPAQHTIDLRISFPFFWRRLYIVLLAGRERRSPERRAFERARHPLATMGNALITAIFCVLIAFPALLSLYALQAALGVGIGTDRPFLAQLMEQLQMLFK